jgi:hypothetical protein
VGHGLTVLNPLTALLAHVEGALLPQLTVLVVVLIRAVLLTSHVGALLKKLAGGIVAFERTIFDVRRRTKGQSASTPK